MHGDHYLLTDILKGRMGFDGFVVGDWNAHEQVPGCTKSDCAAAILAGVDMLMAPDSWKELYRNTLAEARAGVIPLARIDDAVRRILRVKARGGLLFTRAPLRRARRRQTIRAARQSGTSRDCPRGGAQIPGLAEERARHFALESARHDPRGRRCGGRYRDSVRRLDHRLAGRSQQQRAIFPAQRRFTRYRGGGARRPAAARH